MLSLALPVALGELAWMAMGVVDTMMVGRVSAEAIGAISIGRVVFMAVGVFGIGLLLGLDTLVSRAFGAGDRADCNNSLVQGVYLSALLTLPLTAVYRASLLSLSHLGIEPAVLEETVPYMKAIGWTVLPLLLYTTFRRYLQAINLVRPVMLALVTANLVNAAGNWVLIFGKLGAPALGAEGAGWATCISTCYMAVFLFLAIVLNYRESWADVSAARLHIDARRIRALLTLGFPAAIQLTLEVGVFALATVLAGRLEAASLAAHQIALTLASVTYMVPLGISSAGAVRVGQALGRRQPQAAARSGWTAVLLAALFMLLAAVVFVLLRRPLTRLFTADPQVIAVGISLLLVAAVFQLFDGICVAAIGALRGAGDTRNPMLLSLIGYWAIALPVGYQLCVGFGLGVLGLWIGLCVGLIFVSIVVLAVWSRRVRAMIEAARGAGR